MHVYNLQTMKYGRTKKLINEAKNRQKLTNLDYLTGTRLLKITIWTSLVPVSTHTHTCA
jgi:hypothetical protein